LSVLDRESVPSLRDHPGWWPVGFFLRRSGPGRVSSEKLGDLCAAAPSLHADPMPPGMTQESCRPRVSDRTMVGNSATRLACEFQRTEGAVISANMKRRQGGKSIQGPLFRGLAGRSATGRNDQAAAQEMWLRELGAGCRKNILAVPAGRSVFHLTSPLIGLLAHVDWVPDRRRHTLDAPWISELACTWSYCSPGDPGRLPAIPSATPGSG